MIRKLIRLCQDIADFILDLLRGCKVKWGDTKEDD
ncbi:hypothetical protein ES705_29650 [subsurface metagenome]